MDERSERSIEQGAREGNERIKVQALAREVLMNGSSLMTMAEAVAEARKRLGLR